MTYPIPAPDRAFVYLLAGSLRVGGRSVAEGQIAWSDPLPKAPETPEGPDGSTLSRTASDTTAVAMIYSGRPIGEPIQMGGPFVMNTPAEIEQAFRDFHSGGFGAVPRQLRLTTRRLLITGSQSPTRCGARTAA